MTVCIIQARMGSTRLPGKVLKLLDAHPVIWHVYTRCKQAVPRTVVAIPASKENDPLAEYLRGIHAPIFRWDGPEEDVLGRYAACLKVHPADWVVRVTGDCPLVEPAVIRGLVKRAHDTGDMYVSNIHPRSVPSGYDVEVLHSACIRLANDTLSPETASREHVTPWIREEFTTGGPVPAYHLFPTGPRALDLNATAPPPRQKVSVDHPGELDRVRAIIADR